jgi:hypothetical protein
MSRYSVERFSEEEKCWNALAQAYEKWEDVIRNVNETVASASYAITTPKCKQQYRVRLLQTGLVIYPPQHRTSKDNQREYNPSEVFKGAQVVWNHCVYGKMTELFQTIDTALDRIKELSSQDEATSISLVKTALSFRELDR